MDVGINFDTVVHDGCGVESDVAGDAITNCEMYT